MLSFLFACFHVFSHNVCKDVCIIIKAKQLDQSVPNFAHRAGWGGVVKLKFFKKLGQSQGDPSSDLIINYYLIVRMDNPVLKMQLLCTLFYTKH